MRNGFSIVNELTAPVSAEANNHPSATPGNLNYDSVKGQVLHEICVGNYVVSDSKPFLISPLGAVQKSDSSDT